MRPTNLKVLSFNFNLILLALFLSYPSSALSENFVSIKNIFLFCPGCILETVEPCSIRQGPSTAPILCDNVLSDLLQNTVNRAENGSFGEDLTDYPGRPERILKAYLDPDNIHLKGNLLRLLLLSSAGRTITRENLSLILSKRLDSIPSLPLDLEMEAELHLLLVSLDNPTLEQLANLNLFLSNGLSIPHREILISSKNYERLSQILFPYSGYFSWRLGTLGRSLSDCRSGVLPESCLQGIELVKNEFSDDRVYLTRELFLAFAPQFTHTSTEARLGLLREIKNLPQGFFTPDVLSAFAALVSSAREDESFRSEVCISPDFMSVPSSLDSRISSQLASLCTNRGMTSFFPFLLGTVSLLVLWLTVKFRASRARPTEQEIDKISGQLTKLSESYRGEREELAKFFGLHDRATARELNSSFKRLAKILHPDSPTGSEQAYCDLTVKFQRAKEIIVSNF